MSEYFRIKHRSSGAFVSIKGRSKDPDNETNIVMNRNIDDNTIWTFEKIIDHWGYITHVPSGKIIHPQGGSLSPGNNKELVLNSDRHWGALFALDAANDRIIHKGGRFAHPEGDSSKPKNDTMVVLHSDVNEAMRFQFVSTSDPRKEAHVYGKPTIVGKWKIINMVRNPLAEHMDTLQIKVGKSTTESKSTSFQFKWEMSGGFDTDIFKMSVSQSTQMMMDRSSSATWINESTRTREIRVSPGSTVVTWQYVFDAQQDQSKAVFQTNLIADTISETAEPDDVQYAM